MLIGKIKEMSSGLIVVPFIYKGGGYDCVVVKGNDIYPVGGYNLYINKNELEEAKDIDINKM